MYVVYSFYLILPKRVEHFEIRFWQKEGHSKLAP